MYAWCIGRSVSIVEPSLELCVSIFRKYFAWVPNDGVDNLYEQDSLVYNDTFDLTQKLLLQSTA